MAMRFPTGFSVQFPFEFINVSAGLPLADWDWYGNNAAPQKGLKNQLNQPLGKLGRPAKEPLKLQWANFNWKNLPNWSLINKASGAGGSGVQCKSCPGQQQLRSNFQLKEDRKRKKKLCQVQWPQLDPGPQDLFIVHCWLPPGRFPGAFPRCHVFLLSVSESN